MLIASWVISFIVVIGIGILSGNKVKSANEWSGADKTMGLIEVGCLLGAWQIGGMSVVGAAQNGYSFGIAAMWYSLGSALYFLPLGAMAKIVRRNMPGDSAAVYMRSRYNKYVSRFYSFIWLVMAWCYVPVQLKTVASIIGIVLPDISSLTGMFLGLCIAALYTGFAGMKGASIVSKIACFGTYICVVLLVFLGLNSFGGYSGLLEQLPADYSKIFNGSMDIPYVISLVLGGFLSSSVMQTVLQPVMAAKDDRSAGFGCILGYIIGAPICIFTGIIGMMAAARSNMALGDGSTAFAWYVKESCSPLFAGILFAIVTVIIAATMASMMMAAGTVLKEFYGDLINPRATDKQLLNLSRWGTIIFSYSCLLPAMIIPSASLTTLFLTLVYGATCPFSFAIIFGLLWKKVNTSSALWSSIAGVVTSVFWVLSGLNDTVCSVVYPTIIVSYAVGIVISLSSKQKNTLT